MIPNIGASASTSSGAQGGASSSSPFNVTFASGSGVGGGQYGWLVWVVLAAGAALVLMAFFNRRK
jgi:uncharacterized protein HemX